MTRRTSLNLLCLGALAILSTAAFAADLPSAWRAWRYSRAIQLSPWPEPFPATIHLPWDVLAHSSHGSDLRIVDVDGDEAPYVLFFPRPQSTIETRPSVIVERSFVPGHYTQIVIRVTDKPPLDESHGVTLQQLQAEPWFNTYRVLTAETDFMYWIETGISDDAHQWRIVDARSPISRFRKRGLEGNQTVQFEGYSNQRYLRLRIFDGKEQFPVDNVEVLSRSTSEPPRSSLPAVFSPERVSGEGDSRWRADLGTPNLPASELDFFGDNQEFYRAVRVSTSDDGKEWSFPAAGEIYRFRQSGKLKESLRINFPETFARYWRVDILNGNDQPLTNVRLDLRGLERRITVRGQASHTYRLLYGNNRASAPTYDFARVYDRSDSKVLPLAQLGPEELTANYADPRPFTERHPNVLWIALGIAVVLLAYAALRSLKPAAPRST